ncbi:MAG: adenosylcobyric acid synthase [Dinoroseobacter sp.]|jgi:adenosylcobyric acid synthase
MFQGTGSDVGKSTLVAGLCRWAKQQGISVAPFKPQNMSNNAAACNNGGEIGRAQALQARAAGLSPTVHMNPVLLKPQADGVSQVIVQGQSIGESSARKYFTGERKNLIQPVLESFEKLINEYDLILVEGAGSPAETNLRQHDIANMGFATRVSSPVSLIADIDRGGVIAALVGTQQVLDSLDKSLIKSFIINKFRGDPSLFTEGVESIESITGWTCHGIVPWLPAARALPQEDAVVLEHLTDQQQSDQKRIRIAVPMLSRIANFDDMDPLRMEPNVELGFIPPGQPIPLDVDMIILPGTKSTIADMRFMQAQGWDHDCIAFARTGGRIFGICGGYQLLGKNIHDPDGIDGVVGSIEGLGLLDVVTTMQGGKTVSPMEATHSASGVGVQGYEIHMGNTTGPDAARPFARLTSGRQEGSTSASGLVQGTYLHGIFSSNEFRKVWLDQFGEQVSTEFDYDHHVEECLDEVARGLAAELDIPRLFAEAAEPQFS